MAETLDLLGKLIEGEPGRDAVHIAVIPMTAPCQLIPGQRVGNQGNPHGIPVVGIVDPFLTGTVEPGQRFWLWLYPKSTTSLRHEWTHPAFPSTSAPEVNETIMAYMKRKEAK